LSYLLRVQEDCENLRQKVENGLVEKPTVVRYLILITIPFPLFFWVGGVVW